MGIFSGAYDFVKKKVQKKMVESMVFFGKKIQQRQAKKRKEFENYCAIKATDLIKNSKKYEKKLGFTTLNILYSRSQQNVNTYVFYDLEKKTQKTITNFEFKITIPPTEIYKCVCEYHSIENHLENFDLPYNLEIRNLNNDVILSFYKDGKKVEDDLEILESVYKFL